MSNRYCVERLEIKFIATNEVDKTLRVFDDYETNDYILETFPDDDLECLKMCIEQQLEKQFDYHTLDGLFEDQKGVDIDGTFYDWDEIKHLFKDWK